MVKYIIPLLLVTLMISVIVRFYSGNERKYKECEDIMNSQSGHIALLPMSCSQFAERLFNSQK